MDGELMTLRQAAKRLKTSRQTAHTWARGGELAICQDGTRGPGNGILVTRDSVEKKAVDRHAQLTAKRPDVSAGAGLSS